MKVPVPRTRPLSILVVDDYPDTASSLALVLAFEGFATRTALSGAEALSAAAVEPPDVLVIEPRTVGCGWELVRRMAEAAAESNPLLVIYTTDTTWAGRRAAQSAGVGMYMVKPADPTLLVRVLRDFEWVGSAIAPAAARPLRRTGTENGSIRFEGKISAAPSINCVPARRMMPGDPIMSLS